MSTAREADLMTADRRRVPPGAGQPGRQRLGRVPLLEDEQDVAELIRYNLTKAGYDVILSGNGNEALRLAREHDLEIDRHRFEVRLKRRPVELKPKELELLATLAGTPGRVFGREELLDIVWCRDGFVEPRTVDVHVARLRGKVTIARLQAPGIETVRGVGYRFRDKP